MGIFEKIIELSRQVVTEDDWYLDERPYAFELFSKPDGLRSYIGQTSVTFTLPVGPEALSVSRVPRASVEPTQGGIVAEERGLLYTDITISGTFGLAPKTNRRDTTNGPEPLWTAENLSGPMWLRRLIRNVFEAYWTLKADPEYAEDTYLVWHDMKFDEHLVVVPLGVDIERTVTARLQYPYRIRLRGIADGSELKLSSSGYSAEALLAKSTTSLRAGAAIVTAAINEVGRFIHELDQFVTGFSGITQTLTDIVDACTSVVNNSTDLITVGTAYMHDAMDALDSAIALLESATGLPLEVAAQYKLAGDGLAQVAVQLAHFQPNKAAATEEVARAEKALQRASEEELEAAEEAGPPRTAEELAARRLPATAKARVEAGAVPRGRTFREYSAYRRRPVRRGDSLVSIAAQILGDGSLWYELAVLNGLRAPYISEAGLPGTLRPGDEILVPAIGAEPTAAGVQTTPAHDVQDDGLGTNIALRETSRSRPGQPWVDLAIDERTLKDVRLISGVDNLKQAIQMRLWTRRGTMPLLPEYGLPELTGEPNTPELMTELRVAVRSTINADPRVKRLSGLQVKATGDRVEIEAGVIPVGRAGAQVVRAGL